jgi:biopolymer transport protein ExbD
MKYYDVYNFTIDELKEMIANGDDKHFNQIRVTKDGKIYLSQDVVATQALDNIMFRFETFDAGNDYVGVRASEDSEFINRLYRTIMKRLAKGEKGDTYIDVWES